MILQPDLELAGDRASVDGTGTRRRLEALVAIGWPATHLARKLRVSPPTAFRILRGYPVTAGTAKRVRKLYDDMWDHPAPESRERKIALGIAAKRGYFSPLAWDDDEIDDPKARPHGEWRAVA
jgi:hypothetical protein